MSGGDESDCRKVCPSQGLKAWQDIRAQAFLNTGYIWRREAVQLFLLIPPPQGNTPGAALTTSHDQSTTMFLTSQAQNTFQHSVLFPAPILLSQGQCQKCNRPARGILPRGHPLQPAAEGRTVPLGEAPKAWSESPSLERAGMHGSTSERWESLAVP